MPKVVLIDPANGAIVNQRPQLGTLHLAAMLLQQGIETHIIDFTVRPDGKDVLEKHLQSDITCVGISTMLGNMLAGALDVAAFVRERRPDVPIVWGGIHPTLVSESTLKHELVDAVCIGEGEETFIEMIRAYEQHRSLSDVRGIGYKENGKLVFTEPRAKSFDLNLLPPLPYHLVDLGRFKLNASYWGGLFAADGESALSIETSRGCVYRCAYCVHSAHRDKFRAMSAEKVVEGIAHIVRQGVKNVTFNDDNFFLDKKRARRVLSALVTENWGLKIFVAVRSDCLNSMEDSDFLLMKKAGICILSLGVESGCNRTLKRINKRETIEETFKANQRLAKYGINTWALFLYGFPGETKADFLETYNAMQRILRDNPHAIVNLSRLIPNPKTPSYTDSVAVGWKPPETIEQWANIINSIHEGCPAYLDPGIYEWMRDHLPKGVCMTRDLPSWASSFARVAIRRTKRVLRPLKPVVNKVLGRS